MEFPQTWEEGHEVIVFFCILYLTLSSVVAAVWDSKYKDQSTPWEGISGAVAGIIWPIVVTVYLMTVPYDITSKLLKRHENKNTK